MDLESCSVLPSSSGYIIYVFNLLLRIKHRLGEKLTAGLSEAGLEGKGDRVLPPQGGEEGGLLLQLSLGFSLPRGPCHVQGCFLQELSDPESQLAKHFRSEKEGLAQRLYSFYNRSIFEGKVGNLGVIGAGTVSRGSTLPGSASQKLCFPFIMVSSPKPGLLSQTFEAEAELVLVPGCDETDEEMPATCHQPPAQDQPDLEKKFSLFLLQGRQVGKFGLSHPSWPFGSGAGRTACWIQVGGSRGVLPCQAAVENSTLTRHLESHLGLGPVSVSAACLPPRFLQQGM